MDPGTLGHTGLSVGQLASPAMGSGGADNIRVSSMQVCFLSFFLVFFGAIMFAETGVVTLSGQVSTEWGRYRV